MVSFGNTKPSMMPPAISSYTSGAGLNMPVAPIDLKTSFTTPPPVLILRPRRSSSELIGRFV